MVKGWMQQLKPILLALGFVLIVRTVFAEPYSVPTPSMVPTLLVGDELVGSKFAYGYSRYSLPIGELPDFDGRLFGKPPERGDVVVFRLPRDPSTTYVKRLIGLPGDRIQMRSGPPLHQRRAGAAPRRRQLRGRGALCRDAAHIVWRGREHEIIEISDAQPHDNTPVFVVPDKHYFMMGDNRDNSLDSRISPDDGGVGFVPEKNLVARVDRLLVSRDPAVGWLDIGQWAHAFRLDRTFGHID